MIMMMMVQQECGLCGRTKGTSCKRKTILENQVTPGPERSVESTGDGEWVKGRGKKGVATVRNGSEKLVILLIV